MYRIQNSSNNSYAKKNSVQIKDETLIGNPRVIRIKNPSNQQILYTLVEHDPSILTPEGMSINSVNRNFLFCLLNQEVEVKEMDMKSIPIIHKIVFNTNSSKKIKYSDQDIYTFFKDSNILHGVVCNVNQTLITEYIGIDKDILFHIIEHMEDKSGKDLTYGRITVETEILMTGENIKTEKLFKISDLSFEKIGVGGLDKQFEEIFRKVFLTHIIPKKLHEKLGIQHIKGILLYGAPGCGKTRIARSISEILNIKSVKIVNGPEVLNKYVGESEENVRKLFADAESKPDELHMIIFDEFDAICKQRGSQSTSSGVNDSLVNQLLSKIDGVHALNNIILIGLTNRKDLIDEAILRPGRFEVHIEIGLPDLKGRKEIFLLHTKKLREHQILNEDVDIDLIAEKTENMTGAEIESLVKNTVSRSLRRLVDMNDIENSLKTEKKMEIQMSDFFHELENIHPMFGSNLEILDNILRLSPYTEGFNETYGKQVKMIMDQILEYKESGKGILNLLFKGEPKSGKTYLSAYIASKVKFKYTKYVSANDLIMMNEYEKINHILKMFKDGVNSEESLIIIDDIDILVEFTPPLHFSNRMIQGIKTLLGTNVFERKMVVLLITNQYEDLVDKKIFERVHSTYSINYDFF